MSSALQNCLLMSQRYSTLRRRLCSIRLPPYMIREIMYVDTFVSVTYLTLSSHAQVLKKECVSALRRIFKLCDTNKDGILDAAELNEFQVRLHAMFVCVSHSYQNP